MPERTSDEMLPVAAARRGDPDAWDTVFRRYQLPLYSYVFGLIPEEQTVLDIVQETFINATRYISGLRDDRRLGSWLFGIAHQKCVQHWRRQQRMPAAAEHLEATAEDSLPGPDEQLIAIEDESQFLRALAQLEPEHRSAITLHFIEDFSVQEIAQIIGVPPGTVKSRIHYAKKTLKSILASHENAA